MLLSSISIGTPPRTRLRNRVLLPILGRPYAQALEDQELKLVFEQGGLFIQYFDTKMPVAPKSYLLLLQQGVDELQQTLGADHPAFRELGGILAASTSLPERVALLPAVAGERRLQKEAMKERLWNLYQGSSGLRAFIDKNLAIFNGRKRKPSSFVFLDRLLADQAYALSYWLSANDEINYRRFLTITDLVGVRVEDPLVFEATHCLPVYRTYVRSFATRPKERRYIVQALEAARRRNPHLVSQCFDFVEDVLLLREQGHVLPEQREARLAFVMRWQQFTGPITAKGVEDSALYLDNRLISLNEVGGDPSSTGVPVAAFHEFLSLRQKHNRHTLNATSTHDTKRAEDVRARTSSNRHALPLGEVFAEFPVALIQSG